MILSKPSLLMTRCQHPVSLYLVPSSRLMVNVVICKQFSKCPSIINRNHLNHLLKRQTTINEQISYHSNLKGITLIFRRGFKNPPNSFVKHQRNFWGDLLGGALFGSAILYIISFMIDFRYVWKHLTPSKIREPVENGWKNLRQTCIQWAKRADALAASPKDLNEDEQDVKETHEKTKDSGLLHNLLAVFNFTPQESKTDGFRNKKIIEYENRIRLYSTPDKIFRYFATVKIIYNSKESEIYMTPDDFLRALTPGIRQPEGLGLDQFKVVDLSKSPHDDKVPFELTSMLLQQLSSTKQDYRNEKLKNDSIFYKLSNNGLINFTDYLFLLTVISVSPRNFAIAFRMFDLNGDGEVEYEEFAKVQNAILAQTSIGKKMGKSMRYKGVSSAVSKYFFGKDLKQRLTIDHFIDFQETLQKELLTLEFERKIPDSVSNKIREVDFADLLVAYALFNEKKQKRMNERVINKFGNDHHSMGITLDDYLYFFRFLQHINDVDIALAIYHIAGASIDQATLKHVAKTVAHVDLSDHLVDVVFTIFDDDEDGQLSHKEFVAIMKERLRRGLSKPKDTGFLSLMHMIWKSLISFDF